MKSTGVIRRIDELGRIVLPKEIRRNLGIREGENLEIFVEDDRVILKKYSKIKDYRETIETICELVTSVYDMNLLVTDRDRVVYSNQFPEFLNTELDKRLLGYIHNRENVVKNELQTYTFNKEEVNGYFFIQPIISSTDCLGLLLLYSREPIKEETSLLLKFVSNLIVSKVDIS